MSTEMKERTAELFPRILATARIVHNNQPVQGLVEYDDIVQEMALRILERAEQIPDLNEQTNAYLMIDACRNAGYRMCNKEITYLKYVDAETVADSDDESEISIFEIIPSKSTDPEDALIQKEIADELRSRISTMSPECQQFIALAVQGYTDAEIARKLEVSKSAICQRRKTVSKHLVGMELEI